MIEANADLLLARFAGNSPANREEIEKVQDKMGFCLPQSYVEFLLTRNGGEGFIGKRYLVLWRIEELIPMNDAYHVSEFAPEVLLFGSDGGREAFGFDTRSEAFGIVSVPFVGMDCQLVKTVAPDFEAFLSVLLTS